MSERSCGIVHGNIQEAMEHVYETLGDRRLFSKPFWGTKGGNIANVGKVIGWSTLDGQKRWRLDYDPIKGIHINEEDFTITPSRKIAHPTLSSAENADTFWRKWTSRYDKPQRVLDAEKEIDRQKREGFK